MVDAALKGADVPINNTTTYTNGVKFVPSYLLVPHSVDSSNWQQLLIDSGWVETNGKVLLGASEKIMTENGDVLVDEPDLFQKYPD